MIALRVGQTVASSALMQNARPRRRGQASQPRSGAPKAQGLTVAIAVAASSKMPSVAKHAHNSIGATAPISISHTLRIYTSLTDVTKSGGAGSSPHARGTHPDPVANLLSQRFIPAC